MGLDADRDRAGRHGARRKNESGKTAVLQAMYRLRPLPSGHARDFEELRDYPRRWKARDADSIQSAHPVTLTFELDDEDVRAVEQAFGPDVLDRRTISLTKRYGEQNLMCVRSPNIVVSAALRHAVASAGLDVDTYVGGSLQDTVAKLRADEEAAVALADALEGRDIPAEVQTAVFARVPSLLYFDEYQVLPGRVSIRRLQSVAEQDLNPDERTALSLLRLARVDTAEFSEAEYEPRKAALEAAANQLTDELFEYWTQNTELLVELDIEFERGAHPNNPEPFLQIRVRNHRHRVTLNMAERSRGFIWFFSFLTAFNDLARSQRRVILLDEPGLSLHAMAQADLLRFIEERIAPRHQVIYSTHSLFLIDPNHLERCRTVEDVDNEGTKVSQDIWEARPDTVFPLLGALAVDITQTLIVGPNQLLVEGPSDSIYLQVMSDRLRRDGRTSLSPNWTITPVGGVDKVPTFLALMRGERLNVTVLLDVAAGGNQRISHMVDRGILDQHRLLPLTEFTGGDEADIEDMFEEAWYLKLLDKGGVGKVAKSKLAPGGRILRRVEPVIGKFDHFQPANHLLRAPGAALIDEVDGATLDRFEALFTRLNALL